jgi:hypothetical protein
MVFNINDSVFVLKTNEIKKIIDSEIVSEIELYYMSDKTAYPIDELTPIDVCANYFLSNNFDLMSLLEFD